MGSGRLLFAAAALVGLDLTDDAPGGLVGGTASVALGAGVAAAARLPLAVRLAAVGPEPGWWRPTVRSPASRGCACSCSSRSSSGRLVADVDRRTARLGLGPLLFAVSVGGVYATVPDTEQALVLLGVAAPVALLGWPLRRAVLGPAGSPTAVAVLAWSAAVGGVGRPSSIVGAVGCLGLFVVGPLSRRSVRTSAPVVVAAHALLVLVSVLFAGLRPTVRGAVAVVLLELVVGVAVWGAAPRRP